MVVTDFFRSHVIITGRHKIFYGTNRGDFIRAPVATYRNDLYQKSLTDSTPKKFIYDHVTSKKLGRDLIFWGVLV